MQSGSWVLRTGVCFTLFMTSGPLALTAPRATAQQGVSSASRRLPHRPQLPTTPSSADRSRAIATRATSIEDQPTPRAGHVAPTQYLTSETNHALVAPESNTIVSGMTEGEPIESIWQPAESVVNEQGDLDCCVDGPVCWPGFSIDHLSFHGGVHASKNNSTRGQDGSFGFQEGLNFGTAARNIVLPPSVGLQLGFEANQANLEGASFTNDDRKQYFLTLGAFRRSDHGLQGGLVFDYLWDNWNYDLEAGQIRGEISIAITNRNSYGFWFASSVTENDVTSVVSGNQVVETWDTVDYYVLFYRTSLFGGGRGEGQLMAGLTEDSDGIIGGKSRMPLINGWAMETDFTYLVPNEPRGGGANEHESWNLGINLAWYPGTLNCGECFRNHRPMFDVANNGSMILSRQP